MRKKYETDLTDEQWEDAKSQVGKTRIGKCRPVLSQDRVSVAQFTAGFSAGVYCAQLLSSRRRADLSEEPSQALIDFRNVKTTGAVEQKGFETADSHR